jgi:hypothetical protein
VEQVEQKKKGGENQMNNTEALEQRVARLEAALEAERREREALPKLVIPAAADMRRELAALEKTFELTRDAIDERLHALAERDPASAAIFGSILGLIEKQADVVEALLNRTEHIERLLAPALEGRAKLVAQEV